MRVRSRHVCVAVLLHVGMVACFWRGASAPGAQRHLSSRWKRWAGNHSHNA